LTKKVYVLTLSISCDIEDKESEKGEKVKRLVIRVPITLKCKLI